MDADPNAGVAAVRAPKGAADLPPVVAPPAMLSTREGVNAVGSAPPSWGSGEGLICDHRFLPTLPKFTVALPCALALSLAIISSVSGPGVNPSLDSSSEKASAGVAATSTPGVGTGNCTGAVTGSGSPMDADLSQVSAVAVGGAEILVPTVESVATVAASERGWGASPCSPSFILRSMRMVSSPMVSNPPLESVTGLVLSDSVSGLSQVSEVRTETPLVLTDAAAAAAPGGISKESERFRSTPSFSFSVTPSFVFSLSSLSSFLNMAVTVGVEPNALPP